MKEWIMFAIVLIMLALMTYLFSGCVEPKQWQAVMFEDVDKESLIDLLGKGECAGGTIPELKRSIWYCRR
jgi:hypothetical protein